MLVLFTILVLLTSYIQAQSQRPLSDRAERVLSRIDGLGAIGESISDRVGSIVRNIVKRTSSANRITTKNIEKQEYAYDKSKVVNKQRRKMTTYAERKKHAWAIRKFSKSEKTGLRRIG